MSENGFHWLNYSVDFLSSLSRYSLLKDFSWFVYCFSVMNSQKVCEKVTSLDWVMCGFFKLFVTVFTFWWILVDLSTCFSYLSSQKCMSWKVISLIELCMDSFSPCHWYSTLKDFSWLVLLVFHFELAGNGMCWKRYFIGLNYIWIPSKKLCQGMHFLNDFIDLWLVFLVWRFTEMS